MANVHLSIGSSNVLAVVGYQSFREVMVMVGDRCEHDETCGYIYEVSKRLPDGVRADRVYAFGVCHTPHLLRALLTFSIIINATHLAYIDNYGSNSSEELHTITQLLSVVGRAVANKESFKLIIN
jgi:hypothetical protein